MEYLSLYFLAVIAHTQVARAIYALWLAGESRLAVAGAVAWLCVIRIAE